MYIDEIPELDRIDSLSNAVTEFLDLGDLEVAEYMTKILMRDYPLRPEWQICCADVLSAQGYPEKAKQLYQWVLEFLETQDSCWKGTAEYVESRIDMLREILRE